MYHQCFFNYDSYINLDSRSVTIFSKKFQVQNSHLQKENNVNKNFVLHCKQCYSVNIKFRRDQVKRGCRSISGNSKHV